MQDVFHEAVNELNKENPVVVATVIRTQGSTPQKPGAKLLVRSDGSGVGTLGGGCVEGDIWYAAQELMKRGGPAEHREYYLNEELAAEDGLICGGTMYFLIDPIYRPDEYKAYAEEIDAAYAGGSGVALASLVRPANGDEALIGSKLFIRENGTTEGTLGDPGLDREAIKKADELMPLGKNEYVAAENGAEFFVEAYTTPPQLVICGGRELGRVAGERLGTVVAAEVNLAALIIDGRRGLDRLAGDRTFDGGEFVTAVLLGGGHMMRAGGDGDQNSNRNGQLKSFHNEVPF